MPEQMDIEALESTVRAEIADAVMFIDSDIGSQRALATRYYRGEPLGNEEEGRSQVVSRDVHDTVSQILPSLMRIFFGPERVVEFVPQGPEDVEAAEQAADYVNYVVTRDNPGFEIFYAAFKDALIRKTGIVKWWWDDSEEVRTAEYSGLDGIALAKLMEDLQTAEEAEVVESSETEDGLSVTVKLTKKRDRVCLAALPPEEFLIDRRARSIDDAAFVAHRSMKTVSELVAMGYDRDELEAVSQDADDLQFNSEAQARYPYSTVWGSTASEDPTMKLVLYVEGTVYSDVDGDGIAELVRVCTIGPNHKLIHHEPTESRNFAVFPCDPEPHAFFGDSTADNVMDIQRIKTALLRNTLDSLALSLNPRTGVVEGQAVMDDVLNTEIGAIIRMKRADSLFPIPVQDTSASAFNALTYMDQVRESRTGMSRVSQGLNPDALQNMTATASSAQFTQSQQHIELIARIFAETGMKRLFRGVLKLIVENQRKARMVQLRNRWVPVDPRAWRVDMDVTTNVALGAGTNQEKLQLLNLVAQKQEQVMQVAGMDNPMVGPAEYHYTLSNILQLGGFKNPDAFFKDPSQVDPNAQPQQKPPTPEQMKAQAEAQAAQAKLQIETGKLQLSQQQLQLDAQRVQLEQQQAQVAAQAAQQTAALAAQAQEFDQQYKWVALQQQAELALAEIQARYKTTIDTAQIKAEAEGLRVGADLTLKAADHNHDLTMAAHEAQHAKELVAHEAMHDHAGKVLDAALTPPEPNDTGDAEPDTKDPGEAAEQ